MPANVCCPSCWSWSELGKRTTCKQCGAVMEAPTDKAAWTWPLWSKMGAPIEVIPAVERIPVATG